MPDCFISYSSHDERFARYVAQQLRNHNVSVFLADDSLQPGDDWSEELKVNLRNSKWVILLASRAAFRSSEWVPQETGAAAVTSKNLVPVVWNMAPDELPGWAPESQALDLRGASPDEVRDQVLDLAERIRADKNQALMVGAALVAGLIFLGGGQ